MFRKPSRRDLRKSLPPQIGEVQSLERRALPTGTVTVAVVGGSLVVTGDNNDNSVSINVTSSGIQITGHADTKVKVGAVVHAAEEDVSVSAATSVSGDLKLALKGGDDDVEVNISGVAVEIGNKLNVDLGEGDDDCEFNLSSDASLRVKGDVSIATGVGDDSITVAAEGNVVLGRNINVNTGDDEDSISLAFHEVTVAGNANLNTGSGEDDLSADFHAAASFQKMLSINTGDDSDSVEVSVDESLTVQGDATISTGNCDDVVHLSNIGAALRFLSRLTIDTGNGSDDASVVGASLSVSKDLRISTGNHSDHVTLEEQVTVGGDVIVSTGNGSDEVFMNFGIEAGLGITPENLIGRNLKIDCGGGSDDVSVMATGSLEVIGEINIATGLDSDHLSIQAAGEVKVDRDLKIDTGVNQDHVEVIATTGSLLVQGSFLVNLGNEDDCLVAGTEFAITTALDLTPLGLEDATFTVNSDVKITGSQGDDAIGIAGIDIGRDCLVDAGDGDDVIGAATVEIGRNLNVRCGNGDDDLSALDVAVNGTTTIDAGNGNDRVACDLLTFNGDAVVKLGAGDDVIGIGTVDVAVGATIHLDGGLGTDLFDSSTVFGVGIATLLGFDVDLLDLLDDVDESSIQAAIIAAIEACLDLEVEI